MSSDIFLIDFDFFFSDIFSSDFFEWYFFEWFFFHASETLTITNIIRGSPAFDDVLEAPPGILARLGHGNGHHLHRAVNAELGEKLRQILLLAIELPFTVSFGGKILLQISIDRNHFQTMIANNYWQKPLSNYDCK